MLKQATPTMISGDNSCLEETGIRGVTSKHKLPVPDHVPFFQQIDDSSLSDSESEDSESSDANSNSLSNISEENSASFQETVYDSSSGLGLTNIEDKPDSALGGNHYARRKTTSEMGSNGRSRTGTPMKRCMRSPCGIGL